MVKLLVLYSTAACALCERAEALLRSMPELQRVALKVVDIADDDALFARFGTSIPVLEADTGARLVWPFNADDVVALLRRPARSI